ncbi:class I SAM-dependent methyltransferase [Bacillus alkalisoli]|uniref:class I SAM-dependent methyltransferase n=1 Tax=Bacillus alkalisoli TaxID=2011008 RepID=UPI001D0D3066|nr:SAM-dependent methyltransferase [Bacillus alkalisoli]
MTILTHLIEKIKASDNNCLTYADFMQEVLYHPTYGYYMKDTKKVGKEGDFYTSSNVSNVFGKLFARHFYKVFQQKKLPPFIYEIGGGTGRFAKQLLEELKEIDVSFYNGLTYCMIETSKYHISEQKKLLPTDANVVYKSSLNECESIEGIVFSNELYDAFPVHVIEKRERVVNEVHITTNSKNEMMEVLFPLENQPIIDYLNKFSIELSENQRFEVPLSMVKHLAFVAEKVKKGLIYTIDYGYTLEEWLSPELMDGSLRGYYKHEMIRNPLLHVGEMDLTTHIHLYALEQVGTELNLQHCFTKKQGEFLLAAGILNFLQENYDTNPFSEKSKQNRAIRSLVMESGLSKGFTVVVQSKNCEMDWKVILEETPKF